MTWGTCLGKAAYSIYPRFPCLKQEGTQTDMPPARWALCSPDLPHSALKFAHPTELKLPTGFLDLLGSKAKMLQRPPFSALLRNTVPRCDSGIHLAGTGAGLPSAALIPPPHLSPGEDRVEAGQGVEET